MVASRLALVGFIATATASAIVSDSDVFASLLKRQEPGTPSYDCHDNCGTAITYSKQSSDVCNDEGFLHNYENCLQCAGPDNFNIWRYYGGSLTSVAEGCGLDTTPLSGEQPDPSPAIHPGGSSSASPTTEPSETPAPAPTTGAPASTTEGPAPTSEPQSTDGEEVPASTTAPGEPTSHPATASATSTDVTGSPSASDAQSHTPTVVPSLTLSSVSSGVPVPSANGTASFTPSSPPQQSVNAAANLEFSGAAGMLGAMVMGIMYGL